ncbi:MAG: hypothetical protein PHD91_05830 [bacterium]|jgi:hypothetical protein|nr:hypothetical protein [bacterium]MDD4153217.1 hypothetical protein [bacterium]MDD4558054.1 hypothetical protein [bacterium]
MRIKFALMVLLFLIMPVKGIPALVYDRDCSAPAVNGMVVNEKGVPVLNAVSMMVSIDPGATFKYYMVSDFNGWLFYDHFDALEMGYRGGFAVTAYHQDHGTATGYGIAAGDMLYGKKSLKLKKGEQNSKTEFAGGNVTAAPPGVYPAFWENEVLKRYDAVVFCSLPWQNINLCMIGDKKNEVRIKQHGKSYFFYYSPTVTERFIELKLQGYDSRGRKCERLFKMDFDADYQNTGFISRDGGVILIGKDDRTRLEVPPGAFSGRYNAAVTIRRYPLENTSQFGYIYEFMPKLVFRYDANLVLALPEQGAPAAWKVARYDEKAQKWLDCRYNMDVESKTIRIETKQTGRFRLNLETETLRDRQNLDKLHTK